MEIIIENNDKTTTNCGHNFHSSCLFRNIAHNGFCCPYCRNVLTEQIINIKKEEREVEHIDYMDDNYKYNDYELRGFRWFFDRVNGNEIEQFGYEKPYEDVYLEEYYENQEKIKNLIPIPFIKQKLIKKGMTYDDLIKYIFTTDNYDYKLLSENQIAFQRVYTIICEIKNTHNK